MSFIDLDDTDNSPASTWRPDFLIQTDKPVWMKVEVENDGELKPTKAGDGQNLVLKLIIDTGPEVGKFCLAHLLVEGNGSESHQGAIKRNLTLLRAIVDTAKGLDASNQSPEAKAQRRLSSFADLDGLRFAAFVRHEHAPNGNWYNRIGKVLTADMPKYPRPF